MDTQINSQETKPDVPSPYPTPEVLDPEGVMTTGAAIDESGLEGFYGLDGLERRLPAGVNSGDVMDWDIPNEVQAEIRDRFHLPAELHVHGWRKKEASATATTPEPPKEQEPIEPVVIVPKVADIKPDPGIKTQEQDGLVEGNLSSLATDKPGARVEELKKRMQASSSGSAHSQASFAKEAWEKAQADMDKAAQ